MKKRAWDGKKKFQIVLEGIKGKNVSEICNDHQISQSQYYLWREQFLTHGEKVFDVPKSSSNEWRLAKENHELKSLVGELTLQLKKSDEVF